MNESAEAVCKDLALSIRSETEDIRIAIGDSGEIGRLAADYVRSVLEDLDLLTARLCDACGIKEAQK